MKKIRTGMLLLSASLSCSLTAGAMEVPTETVVQNLNGTQQYIKTFTVEPTVDPQTLVEEDFDYEGYTYTFSSIVKEEHSLQDEKQHTEPVSVETSGKDLKEVLAMLEPTQEYSDGTYSGTLYLDHTSIATTAAGYASHSYTIQDTKEIDNLDSNDMAYVPDTVIKDGTTIPLTGVDWQVQGTSLVDDVLVPTSYKAIATYSGTGYYTAATGYVTTAEYVGTISCDVVQNVTYTLTYTGVPIPPVEDPSSASVEDDFLLWPWFLGGGLVIAAGVCVAVLCIRAHHRHMEERNTWNSEEEQTE